MTKIFGEKFDRWACSGETITSSFGPVTIRARIEYDSYHGTPWEECYGHGDVSEWTRRAKEPGERILCEHRGSRRYYDFAGAVAKARREGWNCEKTIALQEGGHKFTPGEVAHLAAENDFEVLRAWCNNEWTWCGIVAELVVDGDVIDDQSLWGIELNYPGSGNAYLNEVAEELAEELLDRSVEAIEAKREELDDALHALETLKAERERQAEHADS